MLKTPQSTVQGKAECIHRRALLCIVILFAGTWQMANDASATPLVPSIFTDAAQLLGSDLSGLVTPGATVAGGTSTFQAVAPGAVNLAYSADLRAYFVGDRSNNRNSFGYSVDGGDPMTVFPYASGMPAQGRSGQTPLFSGDFVELGPQDAGSQLDFFLIARGAEMGGRTETFWADPARNNGEVRAVAFAQADSPYLFVSFEDSFSGSRDYSDMMAAIFMGEQNISALLGSGGPSLDGSGVPVPEPAFVWLIVAGCGLWLNRVRRRKVRGGQRPPS